MAGQTDLIPAADRAILRQLASEVAQIAALPVHQEKAELWRRLNDLEQVRPMVWINEIPWHEMNVDDELTIRCEHPWAKGQEGGFRRLLYQWRHLPGDMIVSDYLSSPLAIRSTGFGLNEDVRIATTDPASSVVSREYRPQIVEPEDLEKIKLPEVHHDEAASSAAYERMCDVYRDVMPVRQVGVKTIWYTPWDNLIRWWGVEAAMLDLIDRPEMVHEAVDRCAASMNRYVDRLEELNGFSFGADNTRVGSGGYGYASDLPADGFDPKHVRAIDNWGCSNAQIFSEISPEMHWEFAVKHDLPWLSRWGLNYYGCCEPLDLKMDVLRRIPNLRKVSMNYRINLDRAVEQVGGDFVFSYKPNPAPMAGTHWRPELCRQELETVLERAEGCQIELILKDISTVAYHPERLWDWAALAMEVVESMA